MMKDIREITSERPVEETWKRLRFLQDVASVGNRIRMVHPSANDKRYKDDVRKQAEQIAHCIRQAEEYFGASTQVGLATRPLLLYYGMTSLSQALVLLNNDGEFSFDRRRLTGKHKHHGLDFVGSVCAKKGLEEFLQSLACKVFVHPEKSIPWGQFAVFYGALVPAACGMETFGVDSNIPRLAVGTGLIRGDDLRPLTALIGESMTAMKLLSLYSRVCLI